MRRRKGGDSPNHRSTSGGMRYPSSKPIFPLGPSGGIVSGDTTKVKLPATGVELSTFYSRDPFRTDKVEALILPYTAMNLGTFQPGAVTVTDPSALLAGVRLQNGFNQLFDVINFRGRFTPNQTIATPGDFTTFLQNYYFAFSALYAIKCVILALGINASFRSFSPGLGSNGIIDRMSIDWDRLQNIPIMPAWPKLLADISGVFFNNLEEWGYVTYGDTATTAAIVTDWSSTGTGVGTLTTLLAQVETALANLEATGSESNIIQEALAIVYGVPQPLPEPRIVTDLILFDQFFLEAATFLVVTLFTQPQKSATGAGGTVPVLIRKGEESNPNTERMFSFLRPAFYDASAVNGSQGANNSLVGMISRASTQNSFARIYGPTANNTIIQDNSFTALNFGNGTFFEVEWWAAFTQSTSGIVNWSLDSRSYDRWHVYYPNSGLLGSNTVKLLDNLISSGMTI